MTMSWLTKIAMKKRWLTFLIIIAVTGVSIWSTLALQMEMIPNIEFPMTSIITVYPQEKPETIMEAVTVKVESAVSGIDRLDQLISTASEGSTFTFAVFEYGTDMKEVNNTIRQNLDELALPPEVRNLPSTIPQLDENPRLFAIDINVMPVVIVSLTGDMLPARLEEIAHNEIIPEIEAVEGVYHVGIDGGSNKKALVNLDVDMMNSAGIAMSQVAAMLGTTQFQSMENLKDSIILPGTSLDDISEIKLGLPSGTTVSRTNGQTSVTISVTKDSKANTVKVANAVIDKLEELKTDLQDGVELVTRVKQFIPPWIRIMRVQRDIPLHQIEAGVTKSNLRQLVKERLTELGTRCNCIRCREVGHREREGVHIDQDSLKIIHRTYEASGGIEEFISAEDKNHTLIGFIRLRIPSENPHRPEISSETGLIRELHVYGEMTPVGEEAQDWQHQGWGEQLMHEAEKTAQEQYDMNRMIVMSALGTKQYYERLGYRKEGVYVGKTLA